MVVVVRTVHFPLRSRVPSSPRVPPVDAADEGDDTAEDDDDDGGGGTGGSGLSGARFRNSGCRGGIGDKDEEGGGGGRMAWVRHASYGHGQGRSGVSSC